MHTDGVGKVTRRISLLLFTAPVLLTGLKPAATRGQSLEWSVAALVLFDTEPSNGTEVGPGLSATITALSSRTLSYFAQVSAARTDFPVASDELHRNFGALAIGVRLAPPGRGPRVGLTLGLGLLAWDDVSETDPVFRSSANGEEMLLPGAEVSVPLGPSWRLTLSVRDQVTGWWNAVFDPDESDVSHRVLVAAGVGF